eukprot:CAMPEP_0197582806 /NCGR_PEP_ID=MMETSP1326-20131121/5910_1 /TAXON_ID=1155430 /ORGANISM="Genus nov. species nov., Strain RCC2288" /LENGTH=890 /DNA_ID=CAMNT_0043146937 /DNA_START=391 /DNA_END=3063 /DNA_ORIENTATION=-
MPGPVYIDPWSPDVPAQCSLAGQNVTELIMNGTAGLMQKCHDTATSTNCYMPVGDSRIVYNKFETCSESWLLLPGFNLLPTPMLAVVYALFLAYLFLGIAIISDKFMSAIEVITAQTTTIKKKDKKTGGEQVIEVKFWNPTVANLTLLALGSSAPEILLAVLETVSNLGDPEKQSPGELGAATIVGSAAFNLLVISAVCMVSVPKGEVRGISNLKVFLMTSFFSVFAYVWVLIVYTIWTPNRISIPEAFITFALFPTFVWLSFAADQNFWKKRTPAEAEDLMEKQAAGMKITEVTTTDEDGKTKLNRRQIATLVKRSDQNEAAEAEVMKHIMALFPSDPWGAMRFRINAVRRLGGKAHKVTKHIVESDEAPELERANRRVHPADMNEPGMDIDVFKKFAGSTETVFMFKCSSFAVMEGAGVAKLVVLRGGPLDIAASVDYYTVDGTADSPADYKAVKGTLIFSEGEEQKTIEVPIVDDNDYEPDENFFVKLCKPTTGKLLSDSVEVTIIDDDEPGYAALDEKVEVSETAREVVITVYRRRGADGKVTVDYATSDGEQCKAGSDYEDTKGTLVFEHGETSKTITVKTAENLVPHLGSGFNVQLKNPSGGLVMSKRVQVQVMFVADESVNRLSEEVLERLAARDSMGKESEKLETFYSQFADAVTLQTSVDDDGNKVEASMMDITLHFFTISWKVLFALVPPAHMSGGLPCFSVSLFFIGVVTAVVEQVATLFGCSLGLSNMVTAITFVAMGTSLPDTFASMQATIESVDADAAIGNITGSNSVNVFLGLGLPWVIGSVYYESMGSCFKVRAGALGFSVTIFLVFCCICLGTMLLRRLPVFGGAELGGSEFGKKSVAFMFFMMWFAYVLISSLQDYGYIAWDTNDDLSTACD